MIGESVKEGTGRTSIETAGMAEGREIPNGRGQTP